MRVIGDRVAIPSSFLELLDQPLAVQLSVLRVFEGWVREGSIPTSALILVEGQPVRMEAAADRPAPEPRNGAAIIPVSGPITRRPTAMSFMCGGTSTEQLSQSLHEAMSDPRVSRVVLAIDSPGGTVDGVPELADEIFAARKVKPITAIVDTVAASAAYWLASQASEIIVTPSGSVGSIGVFGRHIDQSEADAKAGIKVTYISAGKNKVEGNPHEPLSDETRAYFQESVDAAYAMFTKAVARGRGVTDAKVRSEAWGQGRMIRAAEAVEFGMADKVGTLSTIGMSRVSGAQARRADADRQRERAALELKTA